MAACHWDIFPSCLDIIFIENFSTNKIQNKQLLNTELFPHTGVEEGFMIYPPPSEARG